MMRVGGKSHVVCPPDLAYGTGGSPPVIPPGATLAFDIELLGVARPDDARGS
jgi:FKBP-type peptidyl-prolyl cis-trans isomerase